LVYQELDPLPIRSEQMLKLAVLKMLIGAGASGETAGIAVGAGSKMCARAYCSSGDRSTMEMEPAAAWRATDRLDLFETTHLTPQIRETAPGTQP